MRRVLLIICCVVSTSATAVLHAQHADVEFGYSGGMIDIEFGPQARVFEGNFPTTGITERETDDPGFGSEPPHGGGLPNGDLIGYNVLENLYYWNGTAEQTNSGATVTFDHSPSQVPNNVVSQSAIGSANVNFSTGNLRNVIDAIAANGEFHQHIEWTLSAGAPQGAYGVLLDLQTNTAGIGNSETFGIVWNFGLSDPQFEAGVDHFVATRNLAVPEPGSMTLLLGLGVAGVLRRRRRA